MEKTTEQGTLPSFSLGLTQMEEVDEKNINDSSSAGDTNKDHRKREARAKRRSINQESLRSIKKERLRAKKRRST